MGPLNWTGPFPFPQCTSTSFIPKAFESAKLVGVQPTAQSYLYLLSTLSMADDASNMEAVYLELVLQPARRAQMKNSSDRLPQLAFWGLGFDIEGWV